MRWRNAASEIVATSQSAYLQCFFVGKENVAASDADDLRLPTRRSRQWRR